MKIALTTFASLIPSGLDAEATLLDEGIEDVDLDLTADVIGMTVITGTCSLPSIARRLRVSPAALGGSVAANLDYRYDARQLHRFYNCDWVVEAGVRPAPAVS